MPNSSAIPNLQDLIELFFNSPDELGQFDEVERSAMPEPFAELLAHNHHMTVTVEQFHGSLVDVKVVDVLEQGSQYCRKIFLCRQSDGGVVQYGIVRLHCDYMSKDVVDEIRLQQEPLGRILIQRNVLREVVLSRLWRIECGRELSAAFECPLGTEAFGRTALLYCDGEPAIELLEIVSPVFKDRVTNC